MIPEIISLCIASYFVNGCASQKVRKDEFMMKCREGMVFGTGDIPDLAIIDSFCKCAGKESNYDFNNFSLSEKCMENTANNNEDGFDIGKIK